MIDFADSQMKKYSLSDRNKSLHIEHVSADDSATYACEVNNSIGTSKKEFLVDVLNPLKFIADVNKGALDGSDHFETKLIARSGESILLKCPINGKPEPSIYWTMESSNGPNIVSKDPILVIENFYF